MENNKKKGCPYCGGKGEGCSFVNKKADEKYPPSQHLKQRLDGVSERLREYLIKKNPKKWKIPIFTSCYALAYKKKIELDEARERLTEEKKEQDKQDRV